MSKGNDPEVYFNQPNVVALCRAAMHGDLPTIDRLVAEGVDLNARGRDDMYPLLFSFVGFNKQGLERLMEHGADPNLQMKGKGSFLNHAAKVEDSTYLALALAHGGDPNLRGRMDQTPLFDAATQNNQGVAERLQLLLDHGADINAIDRSQENAAMAAAGINQYEPALFLLEKGTDFSQKDRWGYTIAHPLEENGIGYNPGYEGYDARTRVAQFLIDRGVEVQLKKPYEAPEDWLEASFKAIGKPVPEHLR